MNDRELLNQLLRDAAQRNYDMAQRAYQRALEHSATLAAELLEAEKTLEKYR